MSIYCLAVVPGGKYVIVGGSERGGRAGITTTASALALVEVASGKFSLLPEAKEHQGVIRAIAISPDGRRLVTSAGWQYNPVRWLQTNDYAIRIWQLPESISSKAVKLERILVELKDDGQFQIEGRTVNSVELHNRLQWVLKETPEREVHVLPAKKFSGEPFRNLVSMVRSAGGKRVSWPKEVDEHLLQEMTGPELDPAVADAVNDLAAAFEKYLRNIKATSACVGEFPGNLPERIGKPLRTGVERKLRAAGFEIVPATPAPKGVFELSGESYEVQIYKKLPKLNVRYRIGRSGVGAHQGGGGHITTYGRKVEKLKGEDK
jgi:nicotinamidase-related amidase